MNLKDRMKEPEIHIHREPPPDWNRWVAQGLGGPNQTANYAAYWKEMWGYRPLFLTAGDPARPRAVLLAYEYSPPDPAAAGKTRSRPGLGRHPAGPALRGLPVRPGGAGPGQPEPDRPGPAARGRFPGRAGPGTLLPRGPAALPSGGTGGGSNQEPGRAGRAGYQGVDPGPGGGRGPGPGLEVGGPPGPQGQEQGRQAGADRGGDRRRGTRPRRPDSSTWPTGPRRPPPWDRTCPG